MASAAREILDYERSVSSALRAMSKRHHYEAVSDGTPLSHLIEAQDGALDEWGIRNDTIRVFLTYLAGDGPEPQAILRRIFAVGSHMSIEPYCLLNLREKAQMLGESHAAQHWRMKRLCLDPLLRKGAKSIKAPGQKGLKASASAAKAQQGNSNRKFKAVCADRVSGRIGDRHVSAGRKARPINGHGLTRMKHGSETNS